MLLMLVNKKYWSSANTETQEQDLKQDVNKLQDTKRISVLPRGPIVAAHDKQ